MHIGNEWVKLSHLLVRPVGGPIYPASRLERLAAYRLPVPGCHLSEGVFYPRRDPAPQLAPNTSGRQAHELFQQGTPCRPQAARSQIVGRRTRAEYLVPAVMMLTWKAIY